MSYPRLIGLTLLTMIAFAGNSVLCRLALGQTCIDAASFTTVRLASGALVLWTMTIFSRNPDTGKGNWYSAFALFAYAACGIGSGSWRHRVGSHEANFPPPYHMMWFLAKATAREIDTRPSRNRSSFVPVRYLR